VKFVSFWLILGGITVVIDLLMFWWRMSGRLGDQARYEFEAMVNRSGGMRNALIIGVILDLSVPPLALASCLLVYMRSGKGR
jgi:hypothetical protein